MRLRVVQARYGDCVLVESSSRSRRRHRILIDGGAASTFDDHLTPVLRSLPGRRIIDAVVLSHVDNDHVDGLADLFAAQIDAPVAALRELWINRFELEAVRSIQAHPLGIREGADLVAAAERLGIPINPGFDDGIVCLESAPRRIGPLEVTTIGPNQPNIDELREAWAEWLARQVPGATPSGRDRSVPNLSSIMLHIRQGRQTALLTGDGRGDHLLEGLEAAGLSDGGRLHVDAFKLPHHGSARNVDPDLFDRVTADVYIISADGRHGNPDLDVMTMLVESVGRRAGRARIVCTNRTPSIDQVERSHPPEAFGYTLEFTTGHESVIDLRAG